MNFEEVAQTAREAVLATILSSVPSNPTYAVSRTGGYAYYWGTFPGVGWYGCGAIMCVQPVFDQNTAVAILENRALQDRLYEAQCSFNKLADQWKHDTRSASSARTIAMHPAYQKIMVMGKSALPFILNDLEHGVNQWFWALSFIADENPVPSQSRGKIHEMAKAWIDWGRKNGYI